MTKITEYMTNNKLALNQSKTQIMIVSKQKETKDNFNVTLAGKKIKHKKNVIILGNTFSAGTVTLTKY